MKNWDLYLVTEEKLSAGRRTIEVVKEAVAAGIDVVQLREKKMTTRQKYQLGKQIKKVVANKEIDFIINDNLDLALALDSDGVHLGEDDLPIEVARKILGPNKIIGYSTSDLEEINDAVNQGADYVGFGAIYKTNSKDLKERRQLIGLKRLSAVSEETDIPIVAIGGINEKNINDVRSAGADSIAMISAITEADNIKEQVQKLKLK